MMSIEDSGDLAGDLAWSEVAADAELSGEAELAVDGAADLAGDADGRAPVREGGRVACALFGLLFFGGLGAVASLTARFQSATNEGVKFKSLSGARDVS